MWQLLLINLKCSDSLYRTFYNLEGKFSYFQFSVKFIMSKSRTENFFQED